MGIAVNAARSVVILSRMTWPDGDGYAGLFVCGNILLSKIVKRGTEEHQSTWRRRESLSCHFN